MYNHAATQNNLARLREFGYIVADPASGLMACGEDGPGRLPELDEARKVLLGVFSEADLVGEKIVITAGPTREPMDPVRYVSNPSTGKMGYALAQTAQHRGAEVVLVSGPTALAPPNGVDLIRVTTAAEMYEAVLDNYEQATIIVKSAAVVDFRPKKIADRKVKKDEAELTITFARNPDILKELGERKKRDGLPLLVGFAAESHEHLAEGKRKLREKNLDLIVVNDITGDDAGFAADTNRVTLIDRTGAKEELPLLSKEDAANHIWDKVVQLKNEK
jgi:phosphopantothenoylcysteine decarboxylase/phosphopantothenate--cysteine ligase